MCCSLICQHRHCRSLCAVCACLHCYPACFASLPVVPPICLPADLSTPLLPLQHPAEQAGGKDGVVSVFGSRELEAGQLAADGGESRAAAAPPLLSGKLHKGWVAEVQFLSGSGVGAFGAGDLGNSSNNGNDGGSGSTSGSSPTDVSALRLLSAGNDGRVCLWDLGRAAQAGGRGGGLVPQCLASSADLHSGEWVHFAQVLGAGQGEEMGGCALPAQQSSTAVSDYSCLAAGQGGQGLGSARPAQQTCTVVSECMAAQGSGRACRQAGSE